MSITVGSERLCHRALERSGRAPSVHARALDSASAARNLLKHSSSDKSAVGGDGPDPATRVGA
jgi:hypothetical protein